MPGEEDDAPESTGWAMNVHDEVIVRLNGDATTRSGQIIGRVLHNPIISEALQVAIHKAVIGREPFYSESDTCRVCNGVDLCSACDLKHAWDLAFGHECKCAHDPIGWARTGRCIKCGLRYSNDMRYPGSFIEVKF